MDTFVYTPTGAIFNNIHEGLNYYCKERECDNCLLSRYSCGSCEKTLDKLGFSFLQQAGFEKIENITEKMTLDDAISHAEDVANHRCDLCEKCKEEHQQLANWLKELKELREFKKRILELVKE